MQITAPVTGDQANELLQVLLLKKAIKSDSNIQISLIESARSTFTDDPSAPHSVGRWLDQKV